MTKGHPVDWSKMEPRIKTACSQPGGLIDLAKSLGVAYSTLTAHVRALGLRSKAAPRLYKQKFKTTGFNGSPKPGKAPDRAVVIPKGVKVQKCPGFAYDQRYSLAPGTVVTGEFSKLGPGRYIAEE